jgi:uncharacterized protein YbbC (DUF1343 family)
MKLNIIFAALVIIGFTFSCTADQNESVSSEGNLIQSSNIQNGADRLVTEFKDLIVGKRLGIATNHTATLVNGTHIVDTLHSLGYKITALFGPEHGIRGSAPAGEKIQDATDEKTGVPVYSLYGQTRKPTEEMLKDVDVLIFDIQDVGARFYTYISTLFYIIQAGAENNIPVLVLDRGNPIGGTKVEGPLRKEKFSSFVGIAPIPVRHGMTVGELSRYFVGEKLIGKQPVDLTVVEVKGWKRVSYFDEYGIDWNPPSPNIPKLETAIVYPGTCLIEGTNVSEGRGTLDPFLTVGAPYIIPSELLKRLQSYGVEGARLSPADFLPKEIPNMASKPKHEDVRCYGITIEVTDRAKFDAVGFGVKLISAIYSLYPKQFSFRESSFDRLIGDENIRSMITAGQNPNSIIASWKDELAKFMSVREKYLIYKEN